MKECTKNKLIVALNNNVFAVHVYEMLVLTYMSYSTDVLFSAFQAFKFLNVQHNGNHRNNTSILLF